MKWQSLRRVSEPRRFGQRPRSRGAFFEPLETRNLLASLPYGALPDDTGEFMLGDVLVTVVLMESDPALLSTDANTENWTASTINDVKAKITEGVRWWSETLDRMDSVRDGLLNFTFDWTFADNPVSTGYEPISRASTDFNLWIWDFLAPQGFDATGNFSSDIRAFNNHQREQHETDWAFTIFVVNDQVDADDKFAPGGPGSFPQAFAFPGGQFFVSPASRPASTFAHETGHMFWALDEYSTIGNGHNASRGYYNTYNTNAASNPDHAHEPSIMSSHEPLRIAYEEHFSAPTSLEMVGWRDSDGNGIFDVLDVPFDLTGVGKYDAATGIYSFTGSSEVRTLTNRNPAGLANDITINRIRRVEYSIDGGDWTAIEQQYNSHKANLNFGFAVPDGDHEIRIRTVDTRTGVTSVEFIGSTSTPATQTIPKGGSGGILYNDSNNNGTYDQGEMPLVDWALELVDNNGQLIKLNDVVEPDALEGVVNDQVQGAILTAFGSDVANGQVISKQSELVADEGSVLYNNSSLFGQTETWTKSRRLRIDFTTLQTVVNVRAIGVNGASVGRLEAYNTQGELLGRFTTRQLGHGSGQMMSIARPEGDIAYVIASGLSNSEVLLDMVSWGPKAVVTTDVNGAYVLPNLPAGSYKIVVLAPPSFLPTTSANGEAQFVMAAGQSVSDLHFGFRFMGSAWQNTTNPLDIDGDGIVAPIDALIIINRLNAFIDPQLTAERPDGEMFYDVNADINVTALDALIIINYLNSNTYTQSLSNGESVASPEVTDPTPLLTAAGDPDGEEPDLAPAQNAEEYFSRKPLHLVDDAGDELPCMCGACVGAAVESLVAEPVLPAAQPSSAEPVANFILWDTAPADGEWSEVVSRQLNEVAALRPKLQLLSSRLADLRDLSRTIQQRLEASGVATALNAIGDAKRAEIIERVDELVETELSAAWTRLRSRLLRT